MISKLARYRPYRHLLHPRLFFVSCLVLHPVAYPKSVSPITQQRPNRLTIPRLISNRPRQIPQLECTLITSHR